MEYNLADLFESVVDVVPDREALVYVDHPGTGTERRLTYAELDAAANRLALYEIPASTPEMLEFIGILEKQVHEITAGVQALRKPATMAKAIAGHNVEIHRQENLGDRLLNKVTADLFKTNDPVRILKYKEVYEFLELATDMCEDVADVLSDIVRKHG